MHFGCAISVVAVLTLSAPALAESDAGGEPAIIVTAPGGAIDSDDALSLHAADIARSGSPDLLGALTRNIAGVSLQDAQGNPWQPNLVYRGFVASPLQGQAQGLAVYLDGGRFNQPFGDTVQFDLIPQAAIHGLSLLDASPIYGLNALGGAISLSTKTGVSDPGLEAGISRSRFGGTEASMAGGLARGDFNMFAAVQYNRDKGWRAFSPSRLVNGYLDIGLDTEGGGLHIKAIGAKTTLTGNGVAPVELLAASHRAIFTAPDISKNRYGRISLHPWVALSQHSRLEGTLYAQTLKARNVNGDLADIEGCEDTPGLLCLEGEDGEPDALLTDSAGNAIADSLGGSGYGVLNRGRTRTDAMGALFQIIDERALLAGTNHFSLGLSYDASRTHFTTSSELGAIDLVRRVNGLGPIIVQADGAIAPVDVVATTRYWGVFVQDRLSITSRLSAELGLRWNRATIALTDQIGTALNGRHHFNRINPGVELDYEVSNHVSLRLGYAESNRTPTPAELSCADEQAPCSLSNFFVADPPLSQVVAKSFEAGTSGAFTTGGWHANWLLSLYTATNHNDIQYVASNIRGRAWFRNIGSTRRQGVEASLKANRGALAIGVSYAFTNATYRTPLTLSSPANPLANSDGTIDVVRGNRLPGIPRHSGTLSVDYIKARWSIGGDLVARSGQYLVGDEANLNAKVPGYLVANVRASLTIFPGLTLFGEVANVFDRRFATFGTFSQMDGLTLSEAPGASDPRAYGPGAPRRWQAGVKAKF